MTVAQTSEGGLTETYTVKLTATDALGNPAPVPSNAALTLDAEEPLNLPLVAGTCSISDSASPPDQCSITYPAAGTYSVEAFFTSVFPYINTTSTPQDFQVGPASETFTPAISAAYTGTGDTVCGSYYCSSFSATLDTSSLPEPEGSDSLGTALFSYYTGTPNDWVQFASGTFVWNGGSTTVDVSGGVPKETTEVEVQLQSDAYTDTFDEPISLGSETVYVTLSPPLW